MWVIRLVGLFLLVLGTAGVYLFWVLRWWPKRLEKDTVLREKDLIAATINLILALLAIDRFTLGLLFLFMGILGLCMIIFG
jgi:hypothetical protein